MKCQFTIGQWVVCIASGAWTDYEISANSVITLGQCKGPVRNEICKITDIQPLDHPPGHELFCVGLQLQGYPGWYGWKNFRPLNERPKQTSIEVFRKYLCVVSKKVDEQA